MSDLEIVGTDVDPRIDKRRVTMRNFTILPDGTAAPTEELVDFVRPDFLDAYVADAKTRWESVQFSAEPDAGPGGYDGATHVPAHLDVPNAGCTYPATGDEAQE